MYIDLIITSILQFVKQSRNKIGDFSNFQITVFLCKYRYFKCVDINPI